MKFLEYTPLSRLNAFLSNVNLGECILKGVLEAYSCKLAGMDRKLSRSLEQEVLDYLAQSPENHSISPVGPLCSTASMVQAHHFSKECGLNTVKQKIENYLPEAEKVWTADNGENMLLIDCIWKAIDEVIDLVDCDVYSYTPEFEGDPLMERGTIWSFNFLFYNKKLKRILSFSCRCLSKLAIDDLSADEAHSDEETIFLQGMDMD